jgi:hypothetical protein
LKKIFWPLCLLALVAVMGSQSPARADNPVAPFVDSQTNAVIYVDISSVDPDQVDAWQQKITTAAITDPTERAKQLAQSQQSMVAMKKWVADFKTAGGKDMYVVVSLAGMMQGAPWGLVIPLNGADPAALGKVFVPGGNPPVDPNDPQAAQMQRMRTQTAVVGNAMVFSTGAVVDKFKVPSVEPRPDLADALAAGTGTLRLAMVPATLKSNPFFRMMTAQAQQNGTQMPFHEPEWDAVTWLSLSLNAPPKESGNCTFQCKDADSATALSNMLNKKIVDDKADAIKNGNMTPENYDKMAATIKPTVSGTQVLIALDQDSIDNVILPAMIASQQHRAAQMGGPGGPGAPGGAPPDNNGM